MADAVDPALARVMAEQLAYERELQQGVVTYAQLIRGWLDLAEGPDGGTPT